MKRLLGSLWETIEVALVAIVAVFIIRTFIIQPFLVSGASMEPNFESGNYLIIDEMTYRFRPPQRGEVVVFRYLDDPKTFFIKRLIGLPGERIEIDMGKVTIFNKEYPNGYILDEPYLENGEVTSGRVNVTLEEGKYFVLGDNRLHSFDSRGWGSLPKDNLVGLVRVRLWPVTEINIY
jgi:signal peptidase I